MMNFAGPLVAFLWNLLPRKNQTLSEGVQYALHSFFWACVLVLVASQTTHALDVYQHAQQEYRDALRVYNDEACRTYGGPMPEKSRACSALNIKIQAWPLSRALIRVTHDWRAGLQQALVAVTENLHYKVVLVLLALALASYAWRLLRCGKEKAGKAWQKKRYAETEKEMLARMGKQWHLLTQSNNASDFSPLATQQPYQQAVHG
jgi:hypothetical protein